MLSLSLSIALQLLLPSGGHATEFPARELHHFHCESRQATAPSIALTLGEGIYGSANAIRVSGSAAGIAVAYGEGLERALSPSGEALAVATNSPFRRSHESKDKSHNIRTIFSVGTDSLKAEGRGEASLELTLVTASSPIKAVTVKAQYICERAR